MQIATEVNDYSMPAALAEGKHKVPNAATHIDMVQDLRRSRLVPREATTRA